MIAVQPAGRFWRWAYRKAGVPLPCAFAVGFWRRRIMTSDQFVNLRLRERQAVLAHEEGHHELGHVRARLLLLLTGWFFRPRAAARRFQEQELEADLYAVWHGHAWGLHAFLSRHQRTPDVVERLAQLKRYV